MKKIAATSLLLAVAVSIGPHLSAEGDNCTDIQTISLEDIAADIDVCLSSNPIVTLTESQKMELPDPGYTVLFQTLKLDGTEHEVALGRDSSGEIGAFVEGSSIGIPVLDFISNDASVQAQASTITKCSNNAYSLLAQHWGGTYKWYYNPTNQPLALAESLMSSAMSTWKSGTNQCTGFTYANNLSYSKLGTVASEPNAVSQSGTCSGFNSRNGIGWGPISTGAVAATCNKFSGSLMVESDIKFSTNYGWFVSAGTSCVSGMDFQGVATHELGHVLGMSHVSNVTGQTMKVSGSDCDTGMRRLGWGDLEGIGVNY